MYVLKESHYIIPAVLLHILSGLQKSFMASVGETALTVDSVCLYACQAGRASLPPLGIPLDSEPCVLLFCLLADTSNNPHICSLSSLATELFTSELLPEAFPPVTLLTGTFSIAYSPLDAFFYCF